MEFLNNAVSGLVVAGVTLSVHIWWRHCDRLRAIVPTATGLRDVLNRLATQHTMGRAENCASDVNSARAALNSQAELVRAALTGRRLRRFERLLAAYLDYAHYQQHPEDAAPRARALLRFLS
jgi:hypothetical protein